MTDSPALVNFDKVSHDIQGTADGLWQKLEAFFPGPAIPPGYVNGWPFSLDGPFSEPSPPI